MAALVETMFYVREKPWHGLGTRVEEALTSQEAIEKAGLDWTVDPCPVFDQHGIQIQGYVANTRSSDDSVLGIVSNRYSIVQNREAFDFTDNLIGKGLKYETAGSLRGGRQVWLLGKMPDMQICGDKFEPYICFTNTHDGTGAIRCCMTPIRVVCNNTLNLALSRAKRSWSARHIGDINAKLTEARQTLDLADLYLKNFAEEADKLAGAKMNSGMVITVLDQMFKLKDDASERQKETAKQAKYEIVNCMMAPDLAQFVGTKWGFLNAVADWVDHSNPARRTKNWEENRFANVIAGHQLLDKAYELVGVGA
jgi:phage/plasmid-like protein (TIGR03299 family)